MVEILLNQMSVAKLTLRFRLDYFNFFLPNLLSATVVKNLINTIIVSPHACKVNERTICISYCIPFENKWTLEIALAHVYDQ